MNLEEKIYLGRRAEIFLDLISSENEKNYTRCYRALTRGCNGSWKEFTNGYGKKNAQGENMKRLSVNMTERQLEKITLISEHDGIFKKRSCYKGS